MSNNVLIYQCFYREEQRASLEEAFIPFDNSKSVNPNFFEYSPHRILYDKNKEIENAVWGMVSWKWKEKARISGAQFKEWIERHPGYDMYHFNPYPHINNENMNPFINEHPGMMAYMKNLLPLLGIEIDIETFRFQEQEISYCLYWIGNERFWRNWFEFIDRCILVSVQNPELRKYIFETYYHYTDGTPVWAFPFVHERLITLFMYTQRNQMKFLNYQDELRMELYEKYVNPR